MVVLVIHRHPHVSGDERVAPLRLRWPDLVEGQDQVIRPHVEARLVEQRAHAGVLIAVVGGVDLDHRRLAAHERVRRLEAGPGGVGRDEAVQDGRVRTCTPPSSPCSQLVSWITLDT